MSRFELIALALEGAFEIVPRVHGDGRGRFVETYVASELDGALGVSGFVQDNQAFSAAVGTARGLHFQKPPFAQAKLVRVLRGSVVDTLVDLREGSATYGQAVHVRLDAQRMNMVFVPRGFGHGYCTLEPDTEVFYKVDNTYAPDYEGFLAYRDPVFHVPWPIDVSELMMSDKDKAAPLLIDFVSPFRGNS